MPLNLFDMPIIGGITVGLALAINVLVVRYIVQYQRETREEYARRLTRAVIELEAQKTVNARLEYEVERLKYLQRGK
jgi:uncharacterized membrane protein (DUF485 family)